MSPPRRLRFDLRQARTPILIVLASLLLLNLVFYAALVRPKVQEYRALNAENNPRVQALRARQAQVEELEAFVAALEQARTDLTTLREEVLSTRELRMIDVQEELAEICQRFSIDLDLVNYEHALLNEEELEVLRMTVPLEGGYAALRRFLQAVESSDLFLVVERITLVQGKEGGALLQLNITLATYFQAPPERLQRTDGRRA